MLENGEMSVSKEINRDKWYAQNRDRINAQRRAKKKTERKKARARQRAYYAAHPEKHNYTQNKLLRKLRRNGIPLAEARAIVAQSSTLTKETHDGTASPT